MLKHQSSSLKHNISFYRVKNNIMYRTILLKDKQKSLWSLNFKPKGLKFIKLLSLDKSFRFYKLSELSDTKAIKQNAQGNSLHKQLNNKHLTPIKQKKDYSNLYALFQNKTKLPVSTLYSKMDEVKLVTIGLASANRIRQWAEKTLPNGKVVGEVTNANTLHHKTFKPLKGGLFCERIFGPLKDFECACGGGRKTKQLFENANSSEQNQGINTNKDSSLQSVLEHSTSFGHIHNYKRFFCSKCDVEYTWSVIRRYQLGYIKLNAPVTHVWYVKGNPSYISLLLDMKKKHLEYVTYCTETLTLENSLKVAATADEFAIGSDLPQDIYAVWEKATKNNLDVNSNNTERFEPNGANPTFSDTNSLNNNFKTPGVINQTNNYNPQGYATSFDDQGRTPLLTKPLNSKPKNWYYFNNIFSNSLKEYTLDQTDDLNTSTSHRFENSSMINNVNKIQNLQVFSNLKELIHQSLTEQNQTHIPKKKYVVLENTEWNSQVSKFQGVSKAYATQVQNQDFKTLSKQSSFSVATNISLLNIQSNLDDNAKLSPEIKYRNYLVKKEKTINYYKQLFKSGIIQSTKSKKNNTNVHTQEMNQQKIHTYHQSKQSYKTFYTLLTTKLNTVLKNSSSDVMFNNYINNNNSAQISLSLKSRNQNNLNTLDSFPLFKRDLQAYTYFGIERFAPNGANHKFVNPLDLRLTAEISQSSQNPKSQVNNSMSLFETYKFVNPFQLYWKNLLKQTYKTANTEATIRIENMHNKLQTLQITNYDDTVLSSLLNNVLNIRKNLNMQTNILSDLLYNIMSVKGRKIKSLILKALGFTIKTIKPKAFTNQSSNPKPNNTYILKRPKHSRVISGFKLSRIFKIIYMVWNNKNWNFQSSWAFSAGRNRTINSISLIQNTLGFNQNSFVAENLLSDDFTFLDVKNNHTAVEPFSNRNILPNSEDQTLNFKYYYSYNNLFLLVKSVFLQKNTSCENNHTKDWGLVKKVSFWGLPEKLNTTTFKSVGRTCATQEGLQACASQTSQFLNIASILIDKCLNLELKSSGNNTKALHNFLTSKALYVKLLKSVLTNKILVLLKNLYFDKFNQVTKFNLNVNVSSMDLTLCSKKTEGFFTTSNNTSYAFQTLKAYTNNLRVYKLLQSKDTFDTSPQIDKGINRFFDNKRLKLCKPAQTSLNVKHKNLYTPTNSLKTIVNNIYCLSHRELWEQEKDWYFFALYFFTAPDLDDISVPAYEYRNYDFSLLNTFFSSETVNNGLTPNDENNLLNKKDKKTNLHVSYSGAGIIQTLLAEFDYFELKKMDKQNRILLYDLNIYLKKLKKSLAIGFNGAGAISQQLRSEMSEALPVLNEYSLNKKYSTLQKEFKDLCKQRDNLIRRTKLIRKIYKNYYGFSKSTASELSVGNNVSVTNPNQDINLSTDFNKLTSMVLTVLPVLPPDLRPIVKMGSQIAASDLNRLYQRVIYRNDRLKKFLNDIATNGSYEMKYAQRLLQEAVDNLIQNGKSGVVPEKDARGRALKSLSDLLKGKQGRFRQYLLGKRVDYSGRSVIVVGPKLKLHECGIPKEMALELYLPFLIKRILNNNLARTVIGAKSLIKNNKPLVWSLLREIMKTCPVLLNRAPTLHRLGFQAFQPKLVDGRAILLHPLACPAFNADFDGDQMAVHIPITVEARTEAWKLMLSRNNLLSPATGEPLVLPSQDMVLGCYYLTTNSNFRTLQNIKGYGMYFDSFNEVLRAYNNGVVSTHSIVWVKWNNTYENYNGGQFTADQPIEIRINQYGSSYIIYSKSHLSLYPSLSLANTLPSNKEHFNQSYSKNTIVVNKIIRTTPGKIIFNTLIQKAWQT